MPNIGRSDLSGAWNILSRAPMVRFSVPMVIGIATARALDPSLVPSLIIFLLATIAAIVILRIRIEHRLRWSRGVVIAAWMFCLGSVWMTVRDRSNVPASIVHQIENEGPWLVRTINMNRLTATQLRADAEVEAYRDTLGEWRPATGTIMLTLLRKEADVVPKVGDRMLVEAPMKKILRIPDPGGFDRQVWAAARGIELELFAVWDEWKTFDHRTNWIDQFSALRQRIGAWIDASRLNDRERALVKALVLGQRDELDGEQKKAFAESGTIHVLAVSGMHVGLIYAILTLMFSSFGNRRPVRIIRGMVVLAALWMYAGITGGAPSILRATVMFSFITIADMTARRTDPYNSLFSAAFILLLLDPHMLGSIGFQLSFLAVLGIVIFFKPLEELWQPPNWLLRKIWSLAALSIAAQTLTTPVSLYYFKAFPVWFLPANLIVVSAVGLAVYASIGLIIVHKIPFVSELITWILTALLKIVSITTGFFASLPLAYPAIRIDLTIVIMLYVLILSIAGWWLWNWRSMRLVIASSVVMILFVWAINARSINKSRTFTLYDERVGVLASISNGRRYVVLADRDRLGADPFLQRKIDQHRKAKGLASPIFISPGSMNDGAVHEAGGTIATHHRWRTNDLDILFVNAPADLQAGFSKKLDVVIFHDLERITEEMLAEAAAISDRIVLAGKNSYRSREQAAKWCRERNIFFHDVFAQGAFILER